MTTLAPRWTDARLRRIPGIPPPRVAYSNRKGGSGKTTSTVETARRLAAWGLRVRIIDGDPQMASATFWLPPRVPSYRTLDEVFLGTAQLPDVTYPTAIERVMIVPSLLELLAVEHRRPPGSDLVLAQELSGDLDTADVELLDCAPAIGLVTIAMITAANRIVVPLRASQLDRVGVAEAEQSLDLVKQRLNPDVEVAMVLLTGATKNAMITDSMASRFRVQFPEALVMAIPQSVRATEVPALHTSLAEHAPGLPVDLAYWLTAARLVERLPGLEWEIPPAPELYAAAQKTQPAEEIPEEVTTT